MIPRDDDRPAELARRHHAVDRPPELRPLSVCEPAHPGGEAFPRQGLLPETGPPGEGLVVRELPQDDAVCLDDVLPVARQRDPPERPPAFPQQRTDEERDESPKSQRI